MLLVKILGPGCFDCLAVEEAVILGLGQLSQYYPDVKIAIQHVRDPAQIREHISVPTPGLIIDGRMVCAGRIPSVEEVVIWLAASVQEALRKASYDEQNTL